MSPQSVLVLGGTSWLGGEVAASAAAAGHEVTCLARGRSGAAPAGAAFVAADREADGAYAAVAGRDWDLVVDVSWQPGQVRSAVEALADRASHWVYVSSCSVYADQSQPGMDERTALVRPLDAAADQAEGSDYAAAKVRCEQICLERLQDRVLLARPGLIAGYGDPSDRFGYWVGRLALAARDGGAVLVPAGVSDAPAQAVAVGGLAAWLVDAGLRGVGGPLDAVGPRWTFGEVLASSIAAAGFDGELVEASPVWLQRQGVEEYMGLRSLPLWLSDPAYAGFSDRDGSAAAASGLSSPALDDLVKGCLRWELELGLDRPVRRAGLDRADELALIRLLAAPS